MKKNHKKATKPYSVESQKNASTEAITPYKEKPSKAMEGLTAHDLFSLFTAEIIQENIEFTR